MSSKPNHRRGHGRIQDNGPAYEQQTPCGGCNSTHVARSRAKWKARNHRYMRRQDKHLDEDASDRPSEHPNFRKLY